MEKSENKHPKILKFPVRKYKLAAIFNVDTRVIARWCRDVGIDQKSTLLPGQICDFIDHMEGLPDGWIFPHGRQLKTAI